MTAYGLREIKVPYKWEAVKCYDEFLRKVSDGTYIGISLCRKIEKKNDIKRFFQDLLSLVRSKKTPPRLIHIHDPSLKIGSKIIKASYHIDKVHKNKNKNAKPIRVLSWENFIAPPSS